MFRSRPWAPYLITAVVALAISLVVSSFTPGEGVASTSPGTTIALPHWWTMWSMPPVETVGIALVAVYVLRHAAPGWHRISGIVGIVTLAVAVGTPINGMARDGLLAMHMIQHTMIVGFGTLALVAALPRATEQLRGIRGLVAHPLVGFPLWLVTTGFWLSPTVHDQVLTSGTLWVVQQVSFFIFGVLVWCPVLERFSLAPAWFRTGGKCGYMVAVWFTGLGIANVYWFSGTPLYPAHAALDASWGIGAMQDQANAGTVMMLSHCVVSFGMIAVLFWAWAREKGLEQRLFEAGVDPEEIRVAIRSGRMEALADRAGVTVATRPGID